MNLDYFLANFERMLCASAGVKLSIIVALVAFIPIVHLNLPDGVQMIIFPILFYFSSYLIEKPLKKFYLWARRR